MTRSGIHSSGIIILWTILLFAACGGGSGGDGSTNDRNPPATRTFHLGFTPFPHDISQDAIDYVYARLAADADIVAHHFDEGVPWPEALAGTAYDQNILDDWDQRRSRTPARHKVYVAIGSPEWAIVWRDTGLYDENGVLRPALRIWQDTLKNKKYVAATNN